MKICPVGAELFHADGRVGGGQTDMTKLIVAFRNFANAPGKNTENCKTLFAWDGSQYSRIFTFRMERWKLTPAKSER